MDGLEMLEPIYYALDAVAHVHSVEIEQESKAVVPGAQIAEQLSGVDRQQLLYGFEFDRYRVFNKQVEPVADVQS